jgi:hypothetical protein
VCECVSVCVCKATRQHVLHLVHTQLSGSLDTRARHKHNTHTHTRVRLVHSRACRHRATPTSHTTNTTQPRHASYRQPTCPGGTNSRRRGSSGSRGLRAHNSVPHVTTATPPTPQAKARAVQNSLTSHAVVHLGAWAEHLGLRHDGRPGEERAELRRQLAANGNDGEQLHTTHHTHTDRTSQAHSPPQHNAYISSTTLTPSIPFLTFRKEQRTPYTLKFSTMKT